MEFKNPAFNKDYTIVAETDVRIKTPDGYDGPLTAVRKAETLEGMVKRKSNLVALKSESKGVVESKPAPEKKA